MNPLERQLRAVEGYLELGLPEEAREELAAVAPEHGAEQRVLTLRVFVYQALSDWPQMATAAAALCQACPEEAQWQISFAYATRRAHNIEAARAVLRAAQGRFPEEALIPYNLACYECQLGRLEEARGYLREAFRLEQACREMALRDADLTPLYGELKRAAI